MPDKYVLHGVNFSKFDIALGDTLTEPARWDDGPFEAIVSNPPYSTKWIRADSPTLINDERFSPAGVLAPKGKADLAFTMHILSWLAVDGSAAIVQFPGVLYRGGAEKKIRKYLVDGNYVDAVIQLPVDLFFGTSIGTCVLVLKKSKKDSNVLFIDASELFERSGTKNQITEPFRDQILEVYFWESYDPGSLAKALKTLEVDKARDWYDSLGHPDWTTTPPPTLERTRAILLGVAVGRLTGRQ